MDSVEGGPRKDVPFDLLKTEAPVRWLEKENRNSENAVKIVCTLM